MSVDFASYLLVGFSVDENLLFESKEVTEIICAHAEGATANFCPTCGTPKASHCKTSMVKVPGSVMKSLDPTGRVNSWKELVEQSYDSGGKVFGYTLKNCQGTWVLGVEVAGISSYRSTHQVEATSSFLSRVEAARDKVGALGLGPPATFFTGWLD